MALTLEEIKENYSKFPDYKIEKIATERIASLRPEIIEILKYEIEKRKLNSHLLTSITAQLEPISEKDIQILTEKITNAPCPSCSSNKTLLTATPLFETISILLVTNYKEKIFIGCHSCSKKEQKRSVVKSLFLGWWSVWGLLYYTPKTLFKTISAFKQKKTVTLDSFVVENFGKLKAIENNPPKISSLLKKYNSIT